MHIFSDVKMKKHGFRYVFQCGIAGVVIFSVLAAMDCAGQNQAISASLGSRYWSNLLVIKAAVAFLEFEKGFFSSKLLDLY